MTKTAQASVYVDCPSCGTNMAPGNPGCYPLAFKDDGTYVQRTPYGARGEDTSIPCPDCGVAAGRVHHDGCDQETCPVCYGQFAWCDCGWTGLGGTLNTASNRSAQSTCKTCPVCGSQNAHDSDADGEWTNVCDDCGYAGNDFKNEECKEKTAQENYTLMKSTEVHKLFLDIGYYLVMKAVYDESEGESSIVMYATDSHGDMISNVGKYPSDYRKLHAEALAIMDDLRRKNVRIPDHWELGGPPIKVAGHTRRIPQSVIGKVIYQCCEAGRKAAMKQSLVLSRRGPVMTTFAARGKGADVYDVPGRAYIHVPDGRDVLARSIKNTKDIGVLFRPAPGRTGYDFRILGMTEGLTHEGTMSVESAAAVAALDVLREYGLGTSSVLTERSGMTGEGMYEAGDPCWLCGGTGAASFGAGGPHCFVCGGTGILSQEAADSFNAVEDPGAE